MSEPALKGSFRYVLIPADPSAPIQSFSADKAGGLSNDALVQNAKQYFHQATGAKARADQLAQAGPAERQQLASQIRQQIKSSNSSSDATTNNNTNSRIDELSDEAVIDMVYKSQAQPSCDITALTVPTPVNNYKAVSMYAADNAKAYEMPLNERASAIVAACGHVPADTNGGGGGGGIYGDVFLGRADDNEASDIWSRNDFEVAEAVPTAEWCRVARSRGGGGGSGKGAASSLSNLVQQQTGKGGSIVGGSGGGGLQIMDTSGNQISSTNITGDTRYGMNGAPPVQESWGSWTQADDEVELKFKVAAGTKSKYCKISFARTVLKVGVSGQTLLQGTLFDPVVTDECTFTLEDSDDGRDLVVTLGKAETGRTWPYVTQAS